MTPEAGLAIARMIGHITYLSQEAMTRKFDIDRLKPRQIATEFEKIFSVGSYLGYQGERFVERFDANSYIAISMAMDLFDMGATPATLADALRPAASCRWLVASFTSDWLFPPAQSRDLVKALIANRAPVTYCEIDSTCGHDAFLLPDNFATYGEMIRAFIANLAGQTHAGIPVSDEDANDPTSVFRQQRLDYDRLAALIPTTATVLDLGCGSGGLLERLRQEGRRRLVGLDLDETRVLAATRRGLDVIQADLNAGLGAFATREFDYVVLSQTLQTVKDVEGLIDEMLRVGRTCIVSFPNLAYHRLRQMLSREGRSPKAAGLLRYEWYNTPNIRFCSLTDFDEFCQRKNIRVCRRIGLDTEIGVEVLDEPNLNADLAIFVIARVGRSTDHLPL